MADEGKLRRDISRGQQAKDILEHPLVVEALEELEADFTRRWRNSSIGKHGMEDREEAFRYLQVVGRFKRHFEHLMQTGKLAERSLADILRRR